jgi:hypothetical protein
MDTEQDKIDAMKQKVLRSIGESRNNSAQNAERVREIENRLTRISQPPLYLEKTNGFAGPPLALGKASAADPPLFDFSKMPPPPAAPLRRSNTELSNSKNQGPPLLTLSNLPTNVGLPKKVAPPLFSFSKNAANSKAAPAPPAKKSSALPKIDEENDKKSFSVSRLRRDEEEEIEEEPEKPKAVAKKKNKKRSKPKSRSKARR